MYEWCSARGCTCRTSWSELRHSNWLDHLVWVLTRSHPDGLGCLVDDPPKYAQNFLSHDLCTGQQSFLKRRCMSVHVAQDVTLQNIAIRSKNMLLIKH
ncbi:hypothetical protein E2562_017484 [Oryza meyeriana var. granulata]|uniref:Uncharacterized protein n=1 Tax=Oryza meyeriana var. granulata TaxID=110450 RepID=A0A6G1DXH8_9ORYZ|nr:hypothetical protein E2562_017484 [Oryza meyeriana var. granulata]